jgi:preprotein translocase subunit SecD
MEVEPGGLLPTDPAFHEIVGSGHVIDATVSEDGSGGPAIDLRLDAAAADALDAWAADHVGEQVAIVLDDVVFSAPVLRGADYDGSVQISGPFDPARAHVFVAILRGGVLPIEAEALPPCLPADRCALPSAIPGSSAGP